MVGKARAGEKAYTLFMCKTTPPDQQPRKYKREHPPLSLGGHRSPPPLIQEKGERTSHSSGRKDDPARANLGCLQGPGSTDAPVALSSFLPVEEAKGGRRAETNK